MAAISRSSLTSARLDSITSLPARRRRAITSGSSSSKNGMRLEHTTSPTQTVS